MKATWFDAVVRWVVRVWAAATERRANSGGRRAEARAAVRVVRRPWVTDEELGLQLRGHGESPVLAALLNVASRREEQYRSAGDRPGVPAEDRAFLQGGATGLREWQERVEELCRSTVEGVER